MTNETHKAEKPGPQGQPAYFLPYPPYAAQDDDEIDLLELWRTIWTGKWLIILISGLFAAGAVGYALSLPNYYKAEALLAPAEQQGGGRMAALASQFGGLASLAGINLGGGGANQTAAVLAKMKSRVFLKEFIARHELLVPLMASTWSRSDGHSIIDPAVYDERTKSWVDQTPSVLNRVDRLNSILKVSQDKASGLVTVAIEWIDPEQAQQWVTWLVADFNALLKQEDLDQAQRNIDFLQNQLESTQLVEMQRVFYQMIESQTQTVMLADVRDDYAFEVIDPAVVPEERSKPKRSMIVALGTVLGGMFSVLLVLVRSFVKKRQEVMSEAR